jgi:hypothetical protein
VILDNKIKRRITDKSFKFQEAWRQKGIRYTKSGLRGLWVLPAMCWGPISPF